MTVDKSHFCRLYIHITTITRQLVCQYCLYVFFHNSECKNSIFRWPFLETTTIVYCCVHETNNNNKTYTQNHFLNARWYRTARNIASLTNIIIRLLDETITIIISSFIRCIGHTIWSNMYTYSVRWFERIHTHYGNHWLLLCKTQIVGD